MRSRPSCSNRRPRSRRGRFYTSPSGLFDPALAEVTGAPPPEERVVIDANEAGGCTCTRGQLRAEGLAALAGRALLLGARRRWPGLRDR